MLSLIFDASVLFGISVLYGANALFLRRSGIPFFTCYFNDICAGVWFMAYTNLLLRFVKIRVSHLKDVIAYMLFWGLVWEYGAPMIYSRSTSDFMDLVCYEIGAVLYWSMMVFVRSCLQGDGAVSVRVENCASLVGAVQVVMGEAAASVRTGGGEEQGECNDGQDSNNVGGLGRAL